MREDLGIGISDWQVWRICTSMGIKPWRVRTWMTSHAPDFDDRAGSFAGASAVQPGRWCADGGLRWSWRPRASSSV